MTELKTLNPAANSFMANGKKYIVYPSLSVGRYRHFEVYQSYVGWGVDFPKMAAELKGVWDLLNKVKMAEAAVRVNNMLEGVNRVLEGRHHPALLLCTLFICTEDEDRRTWDEAEANEKIEDWVAEGYEVKGFFSYAYSLVTGLADDLETASPSTFQGVGEQT